MAAMKRDESQRLLDEASELLTPVQQDWLLLQLIMKTPSHRLQPLHAEIQRILSFDLVSRLPYMVAERIFSYLDTIALCTAAQCCKKWRELANNDRLWCRLCKARGYNYCDNISLPDWEEGRRPTSPRKKMYDVATMGSHFPPPPCHWKQVYIKGEVLNSNWRHGVYSMTTQRGHQTTVTSMAVEGNLLVSGSRDNTVRVWNIQSLNCVHVLSQHTDEVNCVHIKDNLIFSGSTDGCVRVFDASSGQCLWCLDSHSGAVELLTYQSGWIVSANSDYSLHVWEFVSGQPVHQHVLHGHTMSVTCLQVCSDGTVVSGSWDSSLRIWQSDSGVCGRVLRAHAEGVYCLQCDINRTVSGGGDNMVVLWNTKTGQSLRSFAGHTQEILCVQYNDQLIASCSADSTIRLWKYNGNCVHLLEDHIGLVRCLHLSESRLVSAGDRKKVNVWCTKSGRLLHTVHRQQTLVHLLCVTNTKIITGPPDTGIISIASYW